MITVKAVLEREDFFDAAVLRHGFTDYMRDYDLIIGGRNGPVHRDIHHYQFVGCVEASYQSAVNPLVFTQSLPDAFVFAGPDYPDQDDPDGFVWGVRQSNAYPGLTYLDQGERAQHWTNQLGRRMHEITLETEAFHLRLVFADIRYALIGDEPAVQRDNDMPLPVDDMTSDGGVR